MRQFEGKGERGWVGRRAEEEVAGGGAAACEEVVVSCEEATGTGIAGAVSEPWPSSVRPT